MTSTEIAIRENGQVAERDTVDGWIAVASDVIKLANVIAPTDFVPEVYRDNPPAVAAAILAGRELGIGPMTSLRHVQVVKGAPSLSAEYKRARVLAAGHEFDILELNTTRCRVSGRRRGSNKPPLEVTFTMDDAIRAGLIKDKGAWKTRPRRMLFARAGSELCDFLFSDVVNGLPTAELLSDGGDGYEGYDEAPSQSSPAPAPRTARRARATPAASNEQAKQEPAAQEPRSDAGPPQPPLPGEEEPDPAPGPQQDTGSSPSASAAGKPAEPDSDTPGTVTTPQLTAIWTVLTKVFSFSADEKVQARAVCEHVLRREFAGGTTTDMSRDEAKTVLDTLANWQEVATQRGVTPRELLTELMVAGAQDAAPGENDGHDREASDA
jgi:hypothetical protein